MLLRDTCNSKQQGTGKDQKQFFHYESPQLEVGRLELEIIRLPLARTSRKRPRNYLGSEYVPSQAKLVEPSGFPVALQVPLAFIPWNFPVPLVACHLFVPDCILPFATVPVNW